MISSVGEGFSSQHAQCIVAFRNKAITHQTFQKAPLSRRQLRPFRHAQDIDGTLCIDPFDKSAVITSLTTLRLPVSIFHGSVQNAQCAAMLHGG